MITRSTLLHLRIPFSIFLLPVYLFSLSLSIVNKPSFINVLLSFFIIHFLLYPASNGYNSYFDKDEGSIGGIENPPQVMKDLYYSALILDLIAIFMGLLISIEFAIMLLVYGIISKAYSHPLIRLKKFPYISWLVVGLFQGLFSFVMSWIALNGAGFEVFSDNTVMIPGLLTSLMLWGSYPMTQIYQHDEDSARGDITISLKLGVLGTFHFTALAFTVAVIAFVLYFTRTINLGIATTYVILLTPVLLYFSSWYFQVRKDQNLADFKHTMRLNLISSSMLSFFFLILTFYNYYLVN